VGWKIYFWVIAAFLLLPLPYKLHEYATGRDTSARGIKIEEMANAVFFIAGLPALYGFAWHTPGHASWRWKGWVVAAVALSIAGPLWSPKLRYASAVMGVARTRIVIALGTLAFVPMLVAVFRFASGSA
jgi:hypothetical protein